MSNYCLDLACFYSDLLTLEMATVDVFKFRLAKRGIGLNINKISIGDEIPVSDIYFFASGSDIVLDKISRDLLKNKEFLISEYQNNKVFYGVELGFELLTNYVELKNGERIEGLGIFDAYVKETCKRFSGNNVSELSIQGHVFKYNKLLGFENHSANIFITQNSNTSFLAKVVQGKGNNDKDKIEGAISKNAIGTWLRGPVVVNNVEFADYILNKALLNKYGNDFVLSGLDDEEEKNVYCQLLKKSY